MNIVKVNAIGDNCPIPVVKAKKAIESLTGAAIVEINVDNESSRKSSRRRGCNNS